MLSTTPACSSIFFSIYYGSYSSWKFLIFKCTCTNSSKCKGMRIVISNYTVIDLLWLIWWMVHEQLNVVSHQKYLGIVVDHQLKFYQHTASVASKENQILGIISKSSECVDADRLYKALVRPVIEYANSIWGPWCIYSFTFVTYTSIRGHKLKLCKPRARTNVRLNSFSNRVINDWNNIPANVVNGHSISCFKNMLDKH